MTSANPNLLCRGILGAAIALAAQTSAWAAPDSGTNAHKCYQDSIAACTGKTGKAYTDCIQEGANICAAIYAGSESDVSRKPKGLTGNGGPAAPNVVVKPAVQPAQPAPQTRMPAPGTTKN